MKRAGITKAETRLAVAREALARIKASSSYQEFEPAWAGLLIALNTVHSVLEQSAQASAESRQWYDRKKLERKSDPLLQYVHQARNADEHGIEPIAVHVPGAMSIGPNGESVHIDYMEISPNGRVEGRFIPVDGKFPTIGFTAPHVRLAPVKNRGVTYDPPREHLGQKLTNGASPLDVATMAFQYHEVLIAEASKLPSE